MTGFSLLRPCGSLGTLTTSPSSPATTEDNEHRGPLGLPGDRLVHENSGV